MSSQTTTTPTIVVKFTDNQRFAMTEYGVDGLDRWNTMTGTAEELMSVVEVIDQGIETAGTKTDDWSKSCKRALKAAKKRVINDIESREKFVKQQAEEAERKALIGAKITAALTELWGQDPDSLTTEVKYAALKMTTRQVFDPAVVVDVVTKTITPMVNQLVAGVTEAAKKATVDKAESQARWDATDRSDPKLMKSMVEHETTRTYRYAVSDAVNQFRSDLYTLERNLDDVVKQEVKN